MTLLWKVFPAHSYVACTVISWGVVASLRISPFRLLSSFADMVQRHYPRTGAISPSFVAFSEFVKPPLVPASPSTFPSSTAVKNSPSALDSLSPLPLSQPHMLDSSPTPSLQFPPPLHHGDSFSFSKASPLLLPASPHST